MPTVACLDGNDYRAANLRLASCVFAKTVISIMMRVADLLVLGWGAFPPGSMSLSMVSHVVRSPYSGKMGTIYKGFTGQDMSLVRTSRQAGDACRIEKW